MNRRSQSTQVVLLQESIWITKTHAVCCKAMGRQIVQAWASGNLWAANTTQRAAPPCRHDTALIWRINSAGDLTITFSVCGRTHRSTGGELGKDGWISPIRRGDARTPAYDAVDVVDGSEVTCLILLVANLRSTMIQYNARVAVPLHFSMMLPLHRCYIWAWWSDEALLRLVSPSCKFPSFTWGATSSARARTGIILLPVD